VLKNLSERRRGILALFVLVAIWGILPIIPRFLSADFKLFQQVYLRMALGYLLSVLIFYNKINWKKIVTTPGRDFLLIIFRATCYYLLGVVLNTQALLLTKISNVTLIGTVPITAILGFIILREKITLKKVLLIVLSFVGALIVAVSSFSEFSIGSGELFAFLSSLFISFALVSRKWQSKYLNDQETSVLVLLFSAIEIFAFSIIRGEGLPLNNWDVSAIGFLIAGGLLNAGTSFFSNYGLARVDAVLSGNILMLEPVLASFFGFLVFKELPVSREIFGGLIIIFSVIVMNYSEKK
jgi:drug/metabolite transporter (DMT)-like permease